MRIKSSEPILAEVDMTPMIDIVFQLIAFFMLITNFEQTQADERVKLPSDQLAIPLEVARVKQLTLNIGFIRTPGDKKSKPNKQPDHTQHSIFIFHACLIFLP